ncbi:SRPBCC family protein [Planctomonas psychrotolerans]|uniref:SRPBCC family protein n=1 Tax=Planctomonas psychrotolerans TaxID=2528712 RepID=UPI001238CDCB|nr:SRPBCC family protein [Planctomonas psychrotolerans]
MAVNTRRIDCSPEDVFRILADGWLYPSWVVGASRIRGVEDAWPAAGAKIHHSFGVWPALIDDSTSVLEWDPPHRAVLQARGWPMGEARVTFEVKATSSGCVVRLGEDAVKGPGVLVPAPLRHLGIHYRNTETLRRLAYLAEGKRENAES